MDWWCCALLRNHNVRGQSILILLVLAFGIASSFPLYRISNFEDDVQNATESSASTVEVLRNIQKILGLMKPIVTKTKFVKQDAGTAAAGAESEGAANALAYLTDSFGGQLAGQILSVILASVTGDVRGILGNSLNLFQTDDTRDRVQFFLDEISMNFLKLTGLGAFTTTKPPLQMSTNFPLYFNGQQQQLQQIRPVGVGTVPFRPAILQSGSTLIRPGAPELPSSVGVPNRIQPQQQPQQVAPAQQPIIYVLPSLNGGSSGSGSTGTSGTSGSKTTTGTKVTVSPGDDDSEEDRKLWKEDENTPNQISTQQN